jgi:hypothetical protein
MFLFSLLKHRATLAQSHIFGANIDINLKTCKFFRKYFRKKGKKLLKNRQYTDNLTFSRRFCAVFGFVYTGLLS